MCPLTEQLVKSLINPLSTMISSSTRTKTISAAKTTLNPSNTGRKDFSQQLNKSFSSGKTSNSPSPTSLTLFKPSPKALVKAKHSFVVPTNQNKTGMVPGTETDTVIPKGTTVFQAQVPGANVGNWLSKSASQKPNESGISPFGTTKVLNMTDGKNTVTLLPNNQGVMHNEGTSEVISKKRLSTYVTSHDLPAVQSVAKDIPDTWSAKGLQYNATGGGSQFLIRDKKFLTPTMSEGAKTIQQLRSEAEANSPNKN